MSSSRHHAEVGGPQSAHLQTGLLTNPHARPKPRTQVRDASARPGQRRLIKSWWSARASHSPWSAKRRRQLGSESLRGRHDAVVGQVKTILAHVASRGFRCKSIHNFV